MTKKNQTVKSERLDDLIHEVRGEKVILDADRARVYGVTTKALNQAVKRNAEPFSGDFMFRLSHDEQETIRSQIVTGSQRHRNPRLLPTRSPSTARLWLPTS